MRDLRWVVFQDDGHMELRGTDPRHGFRGTLASVHRLGRDDLGVYVDGALVGRLPGAPGDDEPWTFAKKIAEGAIAKRLARYRAERRG